jgi:hypothetical protein
MINATNGDQTNHNNIIGAFFGLELAIWEKWVTGHQRILAMAG